LRRLAAVVDHEVYVWPVGGINTAIMV
jgi:hypothetical protein